MTTAAIRGMLVVAAAILGLLVVTKAFPEVKSTSQAPAQPVVQDTGALPVTLPSSVPPTTATTGGTGASPQPSAVPVNLQDLAVQVLNGTNENGLAASTAQDLETLGVKIVATANASRTYPITTVFYRDDSKAAAEALVAQKFPGAKLEPANNNLNPKVQVTVVIGEDYAALQGT